MAKTIQKNMPFALITAITFILFFFTPLPSLLVSQIPESWISKAFSPYFQNTALHDGVIEINKPTKFGTGEPLDVLGYQSGICFYFHSTLSQENPDLFKTVQMQVSKRGGQIAEIIAVAPDKKEYHLNATDYKEIQDKDGTMVAAVCQKFGKDLSLIPDTVKSIYVRPLKPYFTPFYVSWETIKKVNLN